MILHAGDYVWWDYRSGIGYGRLKSKAKDNTDPAKIEWYVDEFDHHTGEKNTLKHYGRVLHKTTRANVMQHVRAEKGKKIL